MNKKIIFIPGWMRSLAYYQKYQGVDVWKEKISGDFKTEADYVIAHSLGSTIALLNWKSHSSGKLILVNPLIRKRNFLNWMWRWLCFAVTEGFQADKQVGLMRMPFGIKRFYQLSLVRIDDLLREFPKDKLIIIRGNNDRFFCTKKDRDFLKKNNFNLIEVDDAGHHWNEKFNIEIDKIVNLE